MSHNARLVEMLRCATCVWPGVQRPPLGHGNNEWTYHSTKQELTSSCVERLGTVAGTEETLSASYYCYHFIQGAKE